VATRHALGLPVSLRASFRLLAKPFWSLVVISFFYSIALGVGAICSYIGAIIIWLLGTLIGLAFGATAGIGIGGVIGVVAFLTLSPIAGVMVSVPFLAIPISLTNDHTGPFTALGIGFKVATSNFKAYWVALLVLLQVPVIFALLVGIVAYLLQASAQYFSPTLVLTVGLVTGMLGNAITYGFLSCFQTLVYLDGRCRTEKLDLLLLARDIGMGDDVEQLFLRGTWQPSSAGYPDYAMAVSAPSSAVSVATPVTDGESPTPSATFYTDGMSYPDYSAPPPSLPETTNTQEDRHDE
ncbi:MAG TPA: hypothetical protein VHV83_02810, partial [Armatimonadota bacterium]|nr:hypothetical protein [Armatimonadota bacterium]